MLRIKGALLNGERIGGDRRHETIQFLELGGVHGQILESYPRS